MIFKDILNHFGIDEEFPEYLLDESFNEVFLRGDLSKTNNNYKIVAKTQKKVTHTMFIKPGENFPLIIMSELPNGSLNGVKFGLNEGDVAYINKL